MHENPFGVRFYSISCGHTFVHTTEYIEFSQVDIRTYILYSNHWSIIIIYDKVAVMFEIDFYTDSRGRCPVRAFLDSLDVKMRAKTLGRIELLEREGSELRMPFSRYLEDGIFELRIPQGSNITRVLYFLFAGGKIILANGFVKKTQRTPRKEIELARRFREDWIHRHERL